MDDEVWKNFLENPVSTNEFPRPSSQPTTPRERAPAEGGYWPAGAKNMIRPVPFPSPLRPGFRPPQLSPVGEPTSPSRSSRNDPPVTREELKKLVQHIWDALNDFKNKDVKELKEAVQRQQQKTDEYEGKVNAVNKKMDEVTANHALLLRYTMDLQQYADGQNAMASGSNFSEQLDFQLPP